MDAAEIEQHVRKSVGHEASVARVHHLAEHLRTLLYILARAPYPHRNVELGVRNVKDIRTRQEKIHENIDMVDLTDFEQHYLHQLSGGMQRRAELARALAANPDVLIMDEPFSGLDFLSHMKIREEIVALCRKHPLYK